MSRTKSEIARRLGYKVYDTSLPHEWFMQMMSWLKEIDAEVTNPSAHFVWVYEDKHGRSVFGMPGPLTSVGRTALRMKDKYEEQPVSPALAHGIGT